MKIENKEMRDKELIQLYNSLKIKFPQKSKGYINHFQPGQWIVNDKFQYRFDICRTCGRIYYNKRQRGVFYRVHNWWHYCTKSVCSDCFEMGKHGINPVQSFFMCDFKQ